MSHVLSHQQAKAFYDRFGSKQDLQRIYEDPAVRVLEAHADFEHANAVVEFGCGTGRFAQRLLNGPLRCEATYFGLDISSTMVELAREKVAAWPDRARVQQTDGSPVVPLPNAASDRFLSVYVLDLLSVADARAVLAEAYRVLVPDGRLCLASLTFGQGIFSRGVRQLWSAVHEWRPELVGGCRPIRLLDLLRDEWGVSHHQVVCTFGLCTEVVVARPLRQPSSNCQLP